MFLYGTISTMWLTTVLFVHLMLIALQADERFEVAVMVTIINGYESGDHDALQLFLDDVPLGSYSTIRTPSFVLTGAKVTNSTFKGDDDTYAEKMTSMLRVIRATARTVFNKIDEDKPGRYCVICRVF